MFFQLRIKHLTEYGLQCHPYISNKHDEALFLTYKNIFTKKRLTKLLISPIRFEPIKNYICYKRNRPAQY